MDLCQSVYSSTSQMVTLAIILTFEIEFEPCVTRMVSQYFDSRPVFVDRGPMVSRRVGRPWLGSEGAVVGFGLRT